MKYKKHIATGALALSLLVSGTNVFAASPQDLGIKNVNHAYHQKQNKNKQSVKPKIQHKKVGIVSSINDTGFIVNVKNAKAKKPLYSIDVDTDSSTTYSQKGISASVSDLAIGQKVTVLGDFDRTTNIMTAKSVKIH